MRRGDELPGRTGEGASVDELPEADWAVASHIDAAVVSEAPWWCGEAWLGK